MSDKVFQSKQRGFLRGLWLALGLCLALFGSAPAHAQVDQGTITGIVTDPSGAVIPNAKITLKNIETGLTLDQKSNGSGVYVFGPIKIGDYTVSATAEGFETTTRENLHVNAQQRLNVGLALQPGSVAQTVTITGAPPLLETQSGTVGQTIDTKTINNTPLNGRNWVYIAQLTAGVAPPFGGTRGSGTGDFVANGQRAEQNNFVLDGVDNNTNLVDFLNGSSFVMRPPPDALSEFNLQTSDYSAEFGHSAGAVLSASIKSGTNQIHGDVWEYVRNTSLDARNWNAQTTPPYHQNQFGATIGFPFWKNHLFYFGDVEANRISIGQTNTFTVPTALMRQGDFSELLNGNLTGVSQNGKPQGIQLYQPNSGGQEHNPAGAVIAQNTLACNGQNNVFCANQINPIAQRIINLYPLPNRNGNLVYSNYTTNVGKSDDTTQWDQRVDFNISQRDQAFARYSYLNEVILNQLPLGPLLDGGGYGGQRDSNFAQNFTFSETHIFSPTSTNEFRFGYNWGRFAFLQPNANANVAPTLGLGGVPFAPLQGGLPLGYFNGSNYNIQQWGSVGTSAQSQNVYQILDNFTKVIGNHSLKFGASFQSIRFAYRYAPASLGQYFFNGTQTSNASADFTGNSVADFMADAINNADIANAPNINDAQWYDSGYVQDDWRVTPTLTVNLGVRYDWFQPYKENSASQSNFIPTSLGVGTGTGIYEFPIQKQGQVLDPGFLATLAKDNISLRYVNNQRLADYQKLNFAPRIGFAWQARPTTVLRGGFGLFFGGLQSQGNTNLGSNFPFANQINVYQTNAAGQRVNCNSPENGGCPSSIATLENGLSPVLQNGTVSSFVLGSEPSFHAIDANIKTPYTVNYNISVQQALTSNLVASISYVGNVTRHLSEYYDPNTQPALFNPGDGASGQASKPFPDFGGMGTIHFGGVSTYNSLQTKLEKRFSHGLSFLGTYTWAHALDDASDAAGNFSAIGDRNMALIPIIDEFTNSVFDVRNRVTVNANYELPFGKGRAFVNHGGWLNEVVGGWSSSLTWAAQTGTPFTVNPNVSGPSGGSARAILVTDPFKAGGGQGCAATTRSKANWYNPCAFVNPLSGNEIAKVGATPDGINTFFPAGVTNQATALALLGGRSNQIYGPGYYAVNMSFFKNFTTWRDQFFQFRADAFNVPNHPTLGNPADTSLNSTGGNITGPKFFQNNTPDARFFQLSGKYVF